MIQVVEAPWIQSPEQQKQSPYGYAANTAKVTQRCLLPAMTFTLFLLGKFKIQNLQNEHLIELMSPVHLLAVSGIAFFCKLAIFFKVSN